MIDPLHLTPLEQHVDDLLRFENWERYSQQSAETKAAMVAILPRRRLAPFMRGPLAPLLHGPQFNRQFTFKAGKQ
ncbi:hypothetical protein [Xanthomonas sp. SHU 199]|uniref:hypothetical protein n=1 Tax=Xanthomonas sp. SHU 199 TaxID=1591174 RepID=UPI0003677634|nr:hypothetical protein [Xanthomonas sp. SHU 199]